MSESKEAEYEPEEKRSAKPTFKALSYKTETLQKEQQYQVNKIKGLTRDIKELMKNDNAKAVPFNLEKLKDLYANAKAVQGTHRCRVGRWWQQLQLLLSSLWTRLQDREALPEQLQLLSACRLWARSLVQNQAVQMPPASAVLCAASLHGAFKGCKEHQQNISDALRSLRPEKETRSKQVLVFLLFLCLKDYLSELLCPPPQWAGQNRWSKKNMKYLCSELLALLVNSADWLLLFESNEPKRSPSVALTASDDERRLMPWALCSLLLQQSSEFLQQALQCPGFLHTAICWYLAALQLFLEGDTPTGAATPSELKVEPPQVLFHTKQFVLSLISQAPPAALSSGQLRQLESQCADLDPELAAALSAHLEPHSLGPEVDLDLL